MDMPQIKSNNSMGSLLYGDVPYQKLLTSCFTDFRHCNHHEHHLMIFGDSSNKLLLIVSTIRDTYALSLFPVDPRVSTLYPDVQYTHATVRVESKTRIVLPRLTPAWIALRS